VQLPQLADKLPTSLDHLAALPTSLDQSLSTLSRLAADASQQMGALASNLHLPSLQVRNPVAPPPLSALGRYACSLARMAISASLLALGAPLQGGMCEDGGRAGSWAATRR
jgi:hypothetical protein